MKIYPLFAGLLAGLILAGCGLGKPTALKKDADAAPVRERELVIMPLDNGQWNCNLEDARRVMASAASELRQYFPEREMRPIHVVTGYPRPRCLFNTGEPFYSVRLNTRGTKWAQMSYQFAHEFCHLLCQNNPQAAQMWFQESLCEAASRFALNRMSQTWAVNPPYPHWTGYAVKLKEYFEDLQKIERLPAGTTLGQWYRDNAGRLQADAEDRPRNNVAAAELWHFFDAQPEHWEALTYYPNKKLNPNTLEEFFRVWQQDCPEKHRAFITALAAEFEIRY